MTDRPQTVRNSGPALRGGGATVINFRTFVVALKLSLAGADTGAAGRASIASELNARTRSAYTHKGKFRTADGDPWGIMSPHTHLRRLNVWSAVVERNARISHLHAERVQYLCASSFPPDCRADMAGRFPFNPAFRPDSPSCPRACAEGDGMTGLDCAGS